MPTFFGCLTSLPAQEFWSHDGAHSSILIRGDHLYLNTGTGVDNTHRKIRTPDAPSLVVLDKHTGKLARPRARKHRPFHFSQHVGIPIHGEIGRPRTPVLLRGQRQSLCLRTVAGRIQAAGR